MGHFKSTRLRVSRRSQQSHGSRLDLSLRKFLFLRKGVLETDDALGVSLDEGSRVGLELQLNPVPVPALVVKQTMGVSVPRDNPNVDSNQRGVEVELGGLVQ